MNDKKLDKYQIFMYISLIFGFVIGWYENIRDGLIFYIPYDIIRNIIIFIDQNIGEFLIRLSIFLRIWYFIFSSIGIILGVLFYLYEQISFKGIFKMIYLSMYWPIFLINNFYWGIYNDNLSFNERYKKVDVDRKTEEFLNKFFGDYDE